MRVKLISFKDVDITILKSYCRLVSLLNVPEMCSCNIITEACALNWRDVLLGYNAEWYYKWAETSLDVTADVSNIMVHRIIITLYNRHYHTWCTWCIPRISQRNCKWSWVPVLIDIIGFFFLVTLMWIPFPSQRFVFLSFILKAPNSVILFSSWNTTNT